MKNWKIIALVLIISTVAFSGFYFLSHEQSNVPFKLVRAWYSGNVETGWVYQIQYTGVDTLEDVEVRWENNHRLERRFAKYLLSRDLFMIYCSMTEVVVGIRWETVGGTKEVVLKLNVDDALEKSPPKITEDEGEPKTDPTKKIPPDYDPENVTRVEP